MTWHLRKDVSVGTMIVLLGTLIGGVAAWADLKSKVSNKVDNTTVVEMQTVQKEIRKDIDEVRKDIDKIQVSTQELPGVVAELRALRRDMERQYQRDSNDNDQGH